MAIYLVVLSIIMILGFCIEIGKANRWEAVFAAGRREIRISLTGVFWALIFLTLALFGGLRYNVGTDYESYCTIFTDIAENWYAARYTGTERGYVWLNRIVSIFTDEPQVIIFITNAIITFVGLHCLRKYCRFVPFGLFIFYTTLYYYSFNLIRQGMAATIIFLAMGYASDGKWKKCIAAVVIAGFFHRTAWQFMLPIVVLLMFRYKPSVYFICFALAALATLFRDTVTLQLIARFYPSMLNFEDAYQFEFSFTQVGLCLIYMILCLMYYKPMLQAKKGNIVYINAAIFTFAMYALLFWFPMWSRLNLYFIGLFALIVPEAVSCEKDRKMRIFYYAGILAILLFFYIVPTLTGGGDWHYATYFDKLKELAAEKMIP